MVTPGVKPGNVALVAQSGMMAAALLVQLLSQDVLSVSKACSIGNKYDVDESDLIEYLADDPDTEVIA
ncbi:MAG: acetate--CoA ligase family protein, partial [Acidimicrobiia bacterium]